MMIQPIRFSLTLPAILLTTSFVAADTVYQINAQGKRVVIQREAIVLREDSSFLVYKHFDLKEQRVVKVVLNQGSLPYECDRSSPTERRQIVNLWRRFGYTVTAIDQSGTSTLVADAYLDFYPPGGRGSLLEAVPPRTSVPMLLDNGSADEVDFSNLDRIEVVGDRLRLTLRNGTVEQGKFLMPTRQAAEARLLGITEHYDPGSDDVFDFSLPLASMKQIRFEH